MKNITIQDVAKESGVSITTVSRVINGNYPVSKKTKVKVEKVIKKLGFSPNFFARALIQKKTHTIGVLVPSITNLFFAVVIDGIQDFFKEKGYQIMIYNTDGDSKCEADFLAQLVKRWVDGIISVDPRTELIKNGVYKKISENMPLVLINGYNEGIKLNYVLNDQESGTVEALEYLISLGHRKIAFVRGEESYSYSIKEAVYRNILDKHKIPVDDQLIIVVEKGNSIETIEIARNAAMAVLNEHSFTAAFCCNDWMALGVVYAAQGLRISVPDELSVIGYDNIILSEISMPKLTTVDQNMRTLGVSASKHLYSMLNEEQEGYVKIVLDTKLVIRESCSCAKPTLHSNQEIF